MPFLEKLQQKYQNDGLKILMVNTRESKQYVESYIRSNNFSFSVLLDSEGTVSEKFSVYGLPTAFLIDKHGKIVFHSTGYRNWNTKEMHEAFDSVIEEQSF